MELLRNAYEKVELCYFIILNTLPMYIVFKCWSPIDNDLSYLVAGILCVGGMIRMGMLMSPNA